MKAKKQIIKFCPNCEKEVAVVMNGNRRNKKCYLCKCGRQFIDKKYSTEVKGLAVKFFNLGYSYRTVAKIFNISPNTVRNWEKLDLNFKTPDKEQLKKLKEYKEICNDISLLNNEIKNLESDIPKAEKYWELKNEQNLLYKQREQTKLHTVNYYTITNKINSIHNQIMQMERPKDLLKTEQIQNKLSDIQNNLKKKKSIKIKIETKFVFAREQYNLKEIIKFLEKIV